MHPSEINDVIRAPREGRPQHKIVDLVDHTNAIAKTNFVDTDFYGPGIMLLMEARFENCVFDAELDTIFIEINEARQITGHIALKNTVFRSCRFFGIGMIGNRLQYESFARSFAIGGEWKEDN